MKYDVISFGSAVLDVFIRCPAARLVDFPQMETKRAIAYPYGAKSEVEKLLIASGGGGTNTAVSFSRLGLTTAVAARCGYDWAGKLIREEIKKESVDDLLLQQIEGDQTDYSTILIGPDGGVAILVYRGGTRLEERLINWPLLKASWFYLASLEGNLELAEKIINFSKENRIKIAINPGKKELAQKEKLLPLIKNIDVLILNQEEAAELTDSDYFDPQIFKKAALVSEGLVAVTKGNEGVYLFDQKDHLMESEGFSVEMVDATGAGDAFGAGFVGGLAKGWDLEKALTLGAANGASAVTKIGSQAGLIREKEIESWLNKPLKIKKC